MVLTLSSTSTSQRPNGIEEAQSTSVTLQGTRRKSEKGHKLPRGGEVGTKAKWS